LSRTKPTRVAVPIEEEEEEEEEEEKEKEKEKKKKKRRRRRRSVISTWGSTSLEGNVKVFCRVI